MAKQLPFWSKQLRQERQERGWSQAEMARRLDSSPKNITRWEQGIVKLPSPRYQTRICELFGKTATQLGLLTTDNADLLKKQEKHENVAGEGMDLSHLHDHIDWGIAPHISQLYGRLGELKQLEQWMHEGCKVIAILGLGGIGKTALTVKFTERVCQDFEYVFWRSLQHATTLETILQECLVFLSGKQLEKLSADLDTSLSMLIEHLSKHRCLLTLDNVDAILQSGDEVGHWRKGFEGYGRLIDRIGEAQHGSLLLLTSRDKPNEVAYAQGKTGPVHALHLKGLGVEDGKAFLQDREVQGPDNDQLWTKLINAYSGNPLALKLVSPTIRDVFEGDIARFLDEDTSVFGRIRDLLYQQFQRISPSEQEIMYWLTVARIPISLDDLRKDAIHLTSRAMILRAIESLSKRYMIESSGQAKFTLQPVIMEFLTDELIEEVRREIETEEPRLLARQVLMKAQTRDDIRESQVLFIMTLLVERLQETMPEEDIENRCKRILERLRTSHSRKPNYVAGNLLNLLVLMRSDLRGYDFSHLYVSQAYLQGALLPDVNFSYATIEKSIFTDTFGSVLSVAFNATGDLLAAGTSSCEIRVWRIPDSAPLFTSKGHGHWVRSIAFSPDGTLLASGSEDRTVRLWDVHNGRCIAVLPGATSRVWAVAFSPDGSLLADGSENHSIRLWDVRTRTCLRVLKEHSDDVWTIAFNHDGTLLASGSRDRTIRLWDMQSGKCTGLFEGHSGEVKIIAFSPDDSVLASGGSDQEIRLWDVTQPRCLNTLKGHSSEVTSLAFRSDGTLLASGSKDQTIRLWNLETYFCVNCLSAGTNGITSVSFNPDGTLLASGSNDRTVRLWDVTTGHCINSLRGSTHGVLSVVFRPDGYILASGGEDYHIRLWDVKTGRYLTTLQGHTNWVWSVAFNAHGNLLASGSEDQTIRLWDVDARRCLAVLEGHSSRVGCVSFNSDGVLLASGSNDQTIRLWDVKQEVTINVLKGHLNSVESVTFSPNGSLLASGSEDQTICLWDIKDGKRVQTLYGHKNRVRAVTFSPDGKLLASGSYDQEIRLWSVDTGECLQTFLGHNAYVRSVAFSPDGRLLASCSYDKTIRVWDADTAKCLRVLEEHTDWVRTVAFSPDGHQLVSCSRDGTIRYWDMLTGMCRNVSQSDRPYERMNITGVKGLTIAQVDTLRTLGATLEEERQ